MSPWANERLRLEHQLENPPKSKNISKHGVSEIEVLVWLHKGCHQNFEHLRIIV